MLYRFNDIFPDMSKRVTIYLDSKIYDAVKMAAVQRSRSVSAFVSESLRHLLAEDLIDSKAIHDRLAESTVSYEDVVNRLKCPRR